MELQSQSIMTELRSEISLHGSLKQAWGLGPIQCKLRKEVCKRCLKKHYVLRGQYRDYLDPTKRSVYLGDSYAEAFARVHHVKSFL